MSNGEDLRFVSEDEQFGEDLGDDEFSVDETVEQAESFLGVDIEDFRDSSEDELLEISVDIKKRLNIFGVEGMHSASHERIINLWHNMAMDPYLIEDLALYTSIDKQRAKRSVLARPSFNDLTNICDNIANPYTVRSTLVEHVVVPNLVKYGYQEKNAYRLVQKGTQEQMRAYRFFGWLTDQYFMGHFPSRVQRETSDTGARPLGNRLFSLATDHVRSLLEYHHQTSQKSKYDERVSYHREAYVDTEKALTSALNMCETVFLGKTPQ